MEPWPSASGPIGVSPFQSGKLKELMKMHKKMKQASVNSIRILLLQFCNFGLNKFQAKPRMDDWRCQVQGKERHRGWERKRHRSGPQNGLGWQGVRRQREVCSLKYEIQSLACMNSYSTLLQDLRLRHRSSQHIARHPGGR